MFLRSACDGDYENEAVEGGVHDHPRVDAAGAHPHISEPRAEGGEDRKRLDEAVREAEEEADEHDRRPPAEWLEQAVAEPAKGQFLDYGRDQADDDEVRDERRGLVRMPNLRDEPLLLPRMQERRQNRAED